MRMVDNGGVLNPSDVSNTVHASKQERRLRDEELGSLRRTEAAND